MCKRTSWAQVQELPQSHCSDNQEDTLFPWLHVYYSHLASVRFEHSVCCGSLMTTYITCLVLLVEHFLVHWYQQFVIVHHMPKCMSCRNAIVVVTRRTHCFHDYIYITPIFLLWDLSTLYVVDHIWPLILRSFLCLLRTVWFIGSSNM